MSTVPADIPPRLGLLADTVVAKYLSRGIQTGQEHPPVVALFNASKKLPETDIRWRTAPVRELLDKAMQRYADSRTNADAWLAPRLHATLRLTRAEAADSRLWNFLAILVAPDYVVWRHKSKEGEKLTAAARFSGIHYIQTFARLWWAAELFRNGEDYRPAEIACQVQDFFNSTLRLDVIDHRPTALAIARIVERLISEGATPVGDHVNALSSAVNAAGSTLIYDVLAPDDPVDEEARASWIAEAAEMPPVPWERLPYGPPDGAVSKTAVEALVPLFEQMLTDAPLRKRKSSGDD